jgi:hypothetical protein
VGSLTAWANDAGLDEAFEPEAHDRDLVAYVLSVFLQLIPVRSGMRIRPPGGFCLTMCSVNLLIARIESGC